MPRQRARRHHQRRGRRSWWSGGLILSHLVAFAVGWAMHASGAATELPYVGTFAAWWRLNWSHTSEASLVQAALQLSGVPAELTSPGQTQAIGGVLLAGVIGLARRRERHN